VDENEPKSRGEDRASGVGAHGGGIPPGWDFPLARAAAAEGYDLWLLDSSLKMTPWERIQQNFELVAFAEMMQKALANSDGNK
jgi:hypothetical protein